MWWCMQILGVKYLRIESKCYTLWNPKRTLCRLTWSTYCWLACNLIHLLSSRLSAVRVEMESSLCPSTESSHEPLTLMPTFITGKRDKKFHAWIKKKNNKGIISGKHSEQLWNGVLLESRSLTLRLNLCWCSCWNNTEILYTFPSFMLLLGYCWWCDPSTHSYFTLFYYTCTRGKFMLSNLL